MEIWTFMQNLNQNQNQHGRGRGHRREGDCISSHILRIVELIRAVVSGLIIDTSPDQTAPHIGKT